MIEYLNGVNVETRDAGEGKLEIVSVDIQNMLAGLDSDQRNTYDENLSHLGSEKADEYVSFILSHKYADFFNQYGDSDDANKQAYEEMMLKYKATNIGYLNSLSMDERKQLVGEYLVWQDSHQKGCFGITDAEFDAMGDTDQNEAQLKSIELTNKFKAANKESYDIYTKDNKEYISSKENSTGVNAQDKTVESSINKAESDFDKAGTEKEDNIFYSIKDKIVDVYNMAKVFISEKAIPYVKEAWNKIFDHSKETAKQTQPEYDDKGFKLNDVQNSSDKSVAKSDREIPSVYDDSEHVDDSYGMNG